VTVAQLIILLENMDEDAQVFVEDASGYYDLLMLDIVEESDGVVINTRVYAKTDDDEFLQ
jgi:hypothetical protein